MPKTSLLETNRTYRSLLPIALLLIIAIPQALRAQARERHFTFQYTAAVKDIPAGARRVDLWLPVPHDDPYQQITGLQIDWLYSYEMHQGTYGNRILHVSVDNPKTSDFSVTIKFEAVRYEHIQSRLFQSVSTATVEPVDPDISRWLGPDRLVPLDDQIRKWAREVVEEAGARTDLEKARAIYKHIIATVKYDKSGQGWGRGDIYYACDARRGNCTDFHAIFIGYCRALGIPARFAIGFPLPPERGAGEIKGYHCWAEFYVQGMGWVPVDASEAAKDPSRRDYFFGAHDENRVEFTRGRDLLLAPKQQGEPLNYFIYPYAEVDGKPHAAAEKKFTYRDLGSTGQLVACTNPGNAGDKNGGSCCMTQEAASPNAGPDAAKIDVGCCTIPDKRRNNQ